MFCPAPPVAPTEWQAEQLRSLKMGPSPSACVSVAPKLAFASAKVVAFVPGKASPSDSAPTDVEVLSLESLSPKQPTAPMATAPPSDKRLAHRICRVITNLLCGSPPRCGDMERSNDRTTSRQEKIGGGNFCGAWWPTDPHDRTAAAFTAADSAVDPQRVTR